MELWKRSRRHRRDYKRVIEATGLARSAKDTYVNRFSAFVRWLNDDFEPGSRLKASGKNR